MDEVITKDPKAYDFLRSIIITSEAIVKFANRFADTAEAMAKSEKDEKRKLELLEISKNCRRVPEFPAENFWQASQAFWFAHLAMHLEQNGFSISPGRFDQYCYPLYKKDIEKNIIKEDFASEILSCLWLKCMEITIGGKKISLTQTLTLCG